METAANFTSATNHDAIPPAAPDVSRTPNISRVATVADSSALATLLGIWLTSLESYLDIRNHSIAEENRARAARRDWSGEFRLTHSALLRCARMSYELMNGLEQTGTQIKDFNSSPPVSADEIFALTRIIKNTVLISEGILRAAPLRIDEWKAWCDNLTTKLNSSAAYNKLSDYTEYESRKFLPDIFRSAPQIMSDDCLEILQFIGQILARLETVGKMIERDEPLKPTLLIFARIYEQISQMTEFINNSLLRMKNETDEIFGLLDGVAYVASIELKKVYRQELNDIGGIRPAMSVRAKIEAAHGLLTDSFRQSLIGFAALIDPTVTAETLFPAFRQKREKTLVLRRELWNLLQMVQNAEQNPDTFPLPDLNERLSDFTAATMQSLMYKDWETFERFVEEVVRTRYRKDLVPLLHRFGAYLETLFGQVNMRGVVADFPFEYNKEN